MKIKLRKDKLVEFVITKQLDEAIVMFGSTCGYYMKTSLVPHLWEVYENAERLHTEKAKIFHSVLEKLL